MFRERFRETRVLPRFSTVGEILASSAVNDHVAEERILQGIESLVHHVKLTNLEPFAGAGVATVLQCCHSAPWVVCCLLLTMTLVEEKKETEPSDDNAVGVAVKEDVFEEEGLEAMWMEEDDGEVLAGTPSPVAPSSVQKNRTSFGLSGMLQRKRSNRVCVRLLEGDNMSTTVEKEPSPANNTKLTVDTSESTTSPTTVSGSGEGEGGGDHDLSTLGFDNTFDGDETSPNALSIGSLNEILDAPTTPKEEEGKEQKKRGSQLVRALSPRKQRSMSPSKKKRNPSPSKKRRDASPSKKRRDPSPKKKAAEKPSAPASPSRKSFLVRMSRSRSVPAHSIKDGSKTNKDENKDVQAASLQEHRSFEEGMAVVGGDNKKKNPLRLSPLRKKKTVERFVATVVEKEEDVKKDPKHETEDVAATEVENRLMEQLQAAMMDDECESVASSDGIKKFATMNPPGSAPKKQNSKGSPSRSLQTEPSAASLSSSTSFIPAPKNVPPALLLQKSWESLINNEDVRGSDAPRTITSVPSLEASYSDDEKDDKYSIRKSQDKYSVSKDDVVDIHKHKEDVDDNNKDNPNKDANNDEDNPSAHEDNNQDFEEVHENENIEVHHGEEEVVVADSKGVETKNEVKETPAEPKASKDVESTSNKGSNLRFASFGRGSKKQDKKPAEAVSKAPDKTKEKEDAAKREAERKRKEEEAKQKAEAMKKKREEAAKTKAEAMKKKREEAAKKSAAAEEKKRADMEAKQKKKQENEAKKLAAQQARQEAAEQKKAETEQKKAENEAKRQASLKAKQEAEASKKQAAKKQAEQAARSLPQKQPSSRRLSNLFGGSKRQEKTESGGTEPTESDDYENGQPEEEDEEIHVQLYYGPDLKRVDESATKSVANTQSGQSIDTSVSAEESESDLIRQIRTQSQRRKPNGKDPPVPSHSQESTTSGTRVALDP